MFNMYKIKDTMLSLSHARTHTHRVMVVALDTILEYKHEFKYFSIVKNYFYQFDSYRPCPKWLQIACINKITKNLYLQHDLITLNIKKF
jgi:hypothetical protein